MRERIFEICVISISDWQNVGAFSCRSGERILRVNIIAQSAFVRNAVFLVELRLQGIQTLLRVVRGNYVRTGVNELVNGLAVERLNIVSTALYPIS